MFSGEGDGLHGICGHIYFQETGKNTVNTEDWQPQ